VGSVDLDQKNEVKYMHLDRRLTWT
jgi:hypothetical protein